MANALTLAAPSMPAAVGPLAGVKDGANVNGQNSASLNFANGAPGLADTIANAQFLAALPVDSRLYEVFNTSFASQANLDDALAALGFQCEIIKGATAGTLAILTAAPGKPTATLTTTAATGTIRMSIAASVSR